MRKDTVKHIHPFPARMAPELVFEALPGSGKPADVLDPMMGSGTTLVSARIKGHRATGVDRDPLAVLLASAATRDLDVALFQRESESLLERAESIEKELRDADAYPQQADDETREFVRYWFDRKARRQLASLMEALSEKRYRTSAFLKCAISRMIITKQGGVTLAEDISHSRPHRTRDVAPITPFQLFPRSVTTVIRNSTFAGESSLPAARVLKGDCRSLPLPDTSFDYVITSPPYLNAIDYLRGHKLSLVWFGHSVSELRDIRATNVGSSRGIKDQDADDIVGAMMPDCQNPPTNLVNKLRLYVRDLEQTICEISRVLRPGGTALFVVGDCNIKGVPVLNSLAVGRLAEKIGMQAVRNNISRPLPTGRRYLPPPGRRHVSSESPLAKRMWDEVILTYRAT